LLHLSGDISREYSKRNEAQKPTDDLIAIVEKIVPFLIHQHSEAYAIDLLIEVDKLEDLVSVKKFSMAHAKNYVSISQSIITKDPSCICSVLHNTVLIKKKWIKPLPLDTIFASGLKSITMPWESLLDLMTLI